MKINIENRYEIEAKIKAVERGCTEGCLTYEDIKKMLRRVEKHIDLPEEFLEATETICDLFSKNPAVENSTHFRAKYENGSWNIMDIYRCDSNPIRGRTFCVIYTVEADLEKQKIEQQKLNEKILKGRTRK